MQVSIDRMDNRCISKTRRAIAHGCVASLLGLSFSFGLAMDGAIASFRDSLGCCRDSHHTSRLASMLQHKQKKPNASASPSPIEPGDEPTPDIDDIDRSGNEPLADPSITPLDGESDEGTGQGDGNGTLDTVEPDNTGDTNIPVNPRKPLPPETDVTLPSDTAFPGINQPDLESPLIINDSTELLPNPSLDAPSSADESPQKIDVDTPA